MLYNSKLHSQDLLLHYFDPERGDPHFSYVFPSTDFNKLWERQRHKHAHSTDLLLILWLNNVPNPLTPFYPLLPGPWKIFQARKIGPAWTKQERGEKRGRGIGRGRNRAGTGRAGRLCAEKYGSGQGNEAQWEEEAIRLFSVFKRVLNMALSGMVNLLMLVVFAVVLREMFTAVFHGDCVLDGTKGGTALAYRENVHCKIYWNIKRFI